jgi:small subunit ribosomal protein S8
MSIDALGDFLTIIRNGLMASKRSVEIPYSNIKFEIAKILKEEGFIRDFAVSEESSKKKIQISLKYVDGESVIHELTRISRPGRRSYRKSDQISYVIGKLGISILTTNKGIMTDKRAKELSVGGEIICSVW